MSDPIRRHFRRLAAAVAEWSAPADLAVLCRWAEAAYLAETAAAGMVTEGLTKVDRIHGGEVKSTYFQIWKQSTEICAQCAAQFAATPVARARAGMVDDDPLTIGEEFLQLARHRRQQAEAADSGDEW